MSALTNIAFEKLHVIQQQFGPVAYQDFLSVINASPKLQQQVNEFLGNVRNGTLVLVTANGAKAEYEVSRDDTGTNTVGGQIAFSTNNSNYTGISGASLGYHLAEAFAHELGHAFDEGLGSSAWNAAGAVGGDAAKTVLGVRSEAKAALNAIETMTQARAGLISDASVGLDDTPLPFDKDNWRVSSFAGLESGLRGMSIGAASNDLGATCTQDDACLSMAMNYMGGPKGGNYYESIYRAITGNPSATYPAQLKVLNENEDFKTVADMHDPNRLNVVDKETGEVVQTIDVQIFDDGTALMTVTVRDGKTHFVAVENTGESVETTTLPNGTSTTRAYDTEGTLTTTQTTQVNPSTNQTQQTVLVQIDDEGNTLITTTNADGSGSMRVLDTEGNEIGTANFQRTHNGVGAMDGDSGTVTALVGGFNVTYEAAFAEDFGWSEFDGMGDGEGDTANTLDQVSLLGVNAINGQSITNPMVNASMTEADLDMGDLWAYGGYSQNGDGSTCVQPQRYKPVLSCSRPPQRLIPI
jgi:hypothetical protein